MTIDFGKGKVVAQRTLYEGSIGRFGEEEVELPDGRQLKLAILHHPGAAAVVPFVDAEHVVLLRQYRHAAAGTLWEVPAGKLDDGEAPEICAARELQEETGYQAAKITPLGRIFTSPGFTDEVIHLYRADQLTAGQAAVEADEVLQTVTVSFQEALRMVTAGEITDAKTVCALLHAVTVFG